MYLKKISNFLTNFLWVKKLLIIDFCISFFFFLILSKLLLGNATFLCESHKMLYEIESVLFHTFHGPDFDFEAMRKFLKTALLNVSLEENKEFLRVLLADEYTPKFKFLKYEEYLVKFSGIETQQKQREELVDLILEIYKERYMRLEQMRYFFGICTGIFIFGTFLWTILTISYVLGPRE